VRALRAALGVSKSSKEGEDRSEDFLAPIISVQADTCWASGSSSSPIHRLQGVRRGAGSHDVTIFEDECEFLFERPYVTTRTVAERFGVEQSTASRAITALETESVLEEVTGNRRNKEYRASEIFEILERAPQTY
jgi:predicted HTH transcriptional regulator